MDLRRLKRLAKSHGWTVRKGRRHWQFINPEGQIVATAAHTASDTRSLKNTIGHLRAGGLPVPHRGGQAPRERNQ